MKFEDFSIDRMSGGGKAQIKIEGSRLTLTIIPPGQFAKTEGERLSAIVFDKLPTGTTLRQIHIVLKDGLATGPPGMCRLVFEIFVKEQPKGDFTSQPVSEALYEALITES